MGLGGEQLFVWHSEFNDIHCETERHTQMERETERERDRERQRAREREREREVVVEEIHRKKIDRSRERRR